MRTELTHRMRSISVSRCPVGRHTEAMTRDDVLAICLNLPAAEETYPFGEEVVVVRVGGRMFALVPLTEGPGSVNLKCDPARALELREAYAGIRPGYHQDKRHWNTVDLDGSVEDDAVRGLIEDSYDLVVAGLPRARRAELARD
jgi:predicted DNA-binding protein (MmcQ/YjbR family)